VAIITVVAMLVAIVIPPIPIRSVVLRAHGAASHGESKKNEQKCSFHISLLLMETSRAFIQLLSSSGVNELLGFCYTDRQL